jgi:hypothetical protein
MADFLKMTLDGQTIMLDILDTGNIINFSFADDAIFAEFPFYLFFLPHPRE